MLERCPDRARGLLVLAQEEARLLGNPFLGTEHLLLGLVHEGEGPAPRPLPTLGGSLGTAHVYLGLLRDGARPGSRTAEGGRP